MTYPARRITAHAVIACLAAASIGCNSSTFCTVPLRPALAVTVEDSITRVAPTAASTLTVRDGDFLEVDADSVAPNGSPYEFMAAMERPGIYSVLIETPGYRDWSRADVRVSTETCGLRTVSLTARLQAN